MDIEIENTSMLNLVDEILLNQLSIFDQYIHCRNELNETLRMFYWNISNIKMKQSNTFGSGVGFFNNKFDITKDLREEFEPNFTLCIEIK